MPASVQLDALQNLSLERRTKPLDCLHPVLSRRLLQILERAHPELTMNLHRVVRAQSGNAQHLDDAFRKFLAHRIEERMRSGAVQREYDIGEGRTHARNFLQAVLRHEISERNGERQQALGGSAIGAGAVRIAAAQRRAPPEFDQQARHCRSIKTVHRLLGDKLCKPTCCRGIGPTARLSDNGSAPP
jgi:hypothetical protein